MSERFEMRHPLIVFVASICLSGAAAASAREQLSPEGHAILKAFYASKMAGGHVAPTDLDEVQALHAQIVVAVHAEHPNLATIYDLIAQEEKASGEMRENASRELSELLHKLSPPDQLVMLRDLYRGNDGPPVIHEVAPSSVKPSEK
jgi:hypothetical protein